MVFIEKTVISNNNRFFDKERQEKMISQAFLLERKGGKYSWNLYPDFHTEKDPVSKFITFSSLPVNESVWVFVGSPFFPSTTFTNLVVSFNSSHPLIKKEAGNSLMKHLQEKGYGHRQEKIPILHTDEQGKLKVDFHYGFYTLLLGVETLDHHKLQLQI